MNQKSLDKLSLCHSCYCMTKTIKGVCGKCWNIKPLTELLKNKGKELDWEKQMEWILANRIAYIGNEIPDYFTTDKRSKSLYLGCPQDMIDELQDFIQSLLTQQRTELLEEIKMFPLLIRKEPEAKGYNLAVKEINNKITNLLNKKDE